jgi:hypothetical protein
MFDKGNYPAITISFEMIEEAKRLIAVTKVNRTIASKIDTLTGNLGEFVFAQYFFEDWRNNRVGSNKGQNDFENIEIKTSSFPFNEKLNLLVREDYALKRKPPFYIQIIIDVVDSKAEEIKEGTKAYICGYANFEDVEKAPLKDFGSKHGGKGGYQCKYIPITKLKPIGDLKEKYRKSDTSS